MSWGTSIVCASRLNASPLGPIRCSFKFAVFCFVLESNMQCFG
jgi:hypothetical protein